MRLSEGQLRCVVHAQCCTQLAHHRRLSGSNPDIAMWLTSNAPTPLRTALCSAIKPPFAGYSTGMSQPPKIHHPRAQLAMQRVQWRFAERSCWRGGHGRIRPFCARA